MTTHENSEKDPDVRSEPRETLEAGLDQRVAQKMLRAERSVSTLSTAASTAKEDEPRRCPSRRLSSLPPRQVQPPPRCAKGSAP